MKTKATVPAGDHELMLMLQMLLSERTAPRVRAGAHRIRKFNTPFVREGASSRLSMGPSFVHGSIIRFD
jgi:hypothetical protein